ncbi:MULTISPECIES: flavodoxin domain-containing protein [Corynebacterium]|uniref:flavodoxin domain-containing protein n=1 Tax=Corynebacterium TaxID=1716 RepID=UPI00254D40CC|nr:MULTISPECIES: flavodoxin domain-containing protein [Corynebacterium]MDK6258882.1 flavodoxin domain-containing protein [Corynebacterium frankenforstense]MDK8894996.1 flavodoxin domain-containing protein [Corynebacterium sp. MSK006]
MPAADVFFTTTYGSTRRYAEELAARLGTVARPLDEARAADLSASQAPLVIASPTFGPQVEAADFLADAEIGTRPAAAVAVGMSLPASARERDQMAGKLRDRPGIARFYLPGKLFYSEISRAHRAVMWGVIRALKAKPRKSDNDRAMIAAYDRDVDQVDFSELDPIEAWVCANATH